MTALNSIEQETTHLTEFKAKLELQNKQSEKETFRVMKKVVDTIGEINDSTEVLDPDRLALLKKEYR